MNVPYIPQSHPYSCGAACLSMVLSYFNVPEDEKNIWNTCDKARDTKNGPELITTEGMGKYASKLGMPSILGKVDINNLPQILNLLDRILVEQIPIIIARGSDDNKLMGHFIVVYKHEDNKVYFHNPENNLHSQKEADHVFARKWKISMSQSSGNLIIIFPKDRKVVIKDIELITYGGIGTPKMNLEVADQPINGYVHIGWIKT